MTEFEIAFLCGVVGAMTIFALTLAIVSARASE